MHKTLLLLYFCFHLQVRNIVQKKTSAHLEKRGGSYDTNQTPHNMPLDPHYTETSSYANAMT